VVVLSARSITAAERDRLSEADRVLRKHGSILSLQQPQVRDGTCPPAAASASI
jgi:hypothetical protein